MAAWSACRLSCRLELLNPSSANRAGASTGLIALFFPFLPLRFFTSTSASGSFPFLPFLLERSSLTDLSKSQSKHSLWGLKYPRLDLTA